VSQPSHLRFFPYAAPYDHQREAMATIDEALSDGRDVLFEGACGTGKTLAALAPALEHARKSNKTVVITTNVHQQTRQFIEEARAITRQESIRAVVFRGKLDMCHIDVGYDECQALRDTTRELVETEQERDELGDALSDADLDGADSSQDIEGRNAVMDEIDSLETELDDLQEQATCERYYNNLTEDTDAFYEWLFADVRTPDEIYEYAHSEGLCGYELLKEGMEGIDLAICNYHHVLDPMIREQFFRWLGRDPEDVVCVFDEAHNIENAARDHATRTLTESTLDGALSEMETVDDARKGSAENVIQAFRDALVQTYDDTLAFGERERVGDEWYDLSITNEVGRDDLTLTFLDAYTGNGIHGDLDRALDLGNSLDRSYKQAYKNGETQTRKECRILQAAAFIDDWLRDSDEKGMYPVVSVRRDGGSDTVYGRSELYTCIPRQVTRPLFEELHASVLMSATLRPFDVLTEVLGITEAETMAYGAQFPDERRRTYMVDTPALFSRRRDEYEVQRTITGVLEDAIEFTPGNTLCFFPSYREAERYHDLLDVDSSLYLDAPGTNVEESKRTFTTGENGVFLTSLWGTLAEGVSFDDDDARTVVVVGVPYPRLDDRMEAVQSTYAAAFDSDDRTTATADDAGWEYAVEIPTIRKTRQAIGRVVRSPEDFGARILVDERYTVRSQQEMRKYSVRETFPSEERSETIDIVPEKLKFALLNFYSDMDAWSGSPPVP
jgi:DNA excision repair protein ERCC-2